MPVEIRELIIRSTIRERPQDTRISEPVRLPNKDEIVQEAVEKVLEIIEKKKER